MRRPAAPLEARAIGRIAPDGPWIGFARRGGEWLFVLGTGTGVREAPAGTDMLLALAIAHFAQALDEAPPDLEATQSDLSGMVRHLIGTEADAHRRALLTEAQDAIDDGLAGDAVAGRLAAARTAEKAFADPVELLLAAARKLAEGG